MEFPVVSRASSQARPGAPPVHWHRHSSHGTHVRGLVPGAPLQAASRPRPQGAAQRHPLEHPSPNGLPRQASLSSQLEPHAGSIPTQVTISGRGGQLPGTYQGRRGPRPLRGAANGPGAVSCSPSSSVRVAAGHEPLNRPRPRRALANGYEPSPAVNDAPPTSPVIPRPSWVILVRARAWASSAWVASSAGSLRPSFLSTEP